MKLPAIFDRPCAWLGLFLSLVPVAGAWAAETPLFFREDFAELPAEIPVAQKHLSNSELILRRHGPGADQIKRSFHDNIPNDPHYIWSGLCETPWAVSFERRGHVADLSEGASIRWRVRQSGERTLRVVIETAQGWFVSDAGTGSSEAWVIDAIGLDGVHWKPLDIQRVQSGDYAATPDLSRVWAIGVTDLEPGQGSRVSSRLDWIEVYAHESSAPNVILMMGDDHGWEETGYNGHPYLRTPHLDAMATSGLRFDRFYAGHPSCSPTRGSFLTGRHPNRYGTFTPNHSMRPEERTIAHLASANGYATAHFGKWHVGPVKAASPTSPGAMGFDTWLSHDNFFELNPTLSRDGSQPQQLEGESSAILIDEAIAFIEGARRQRQPFLTVLWFGSPHEPYSGLPEDLGLYDDLPMEWTQKQVRLTSNVTGRSTQRPLRDVLRERFAEITAMDRAIGRLRGYLARSGLRENTLFWYCGDNGTPPSGLATSPFRGLKGKVYEGGIRVPGVLEWPARIPQPRATGVPAVTSDFLPTLAGILGADAGERPIDGVDLLPLIDGEMGERPAPVGFWSLNTGPAPEGGWQPYIDPELQRGTTPLVKLMGDIPTRKFRNVVYPEVREIDLRGPRVWMDNAWKLVIHETDGVAQRELFHLVADPRETENLAATEIARTEAMAAALEAWQRSVLTSLTGADYR